MKLAFITSTFSFPMLYECPESYRAAARNLSGENIGSVFMVFTSERDPRRHSAPHDGKGAIANGTDQHRYRGTLPGVPRGLAVYNHVPEQRLSSPATLRDSGQSAPAILTVVKCFVADMEVPSAFRTDIGS